MSADDVPGWYDQLGAPERPHVLDQVEAFLRSFVVYPSDAAAVAHVLWVAHTWAVDTFDSTPRIAFLSPEPGSGKSRALEVTEHLVPRPVHAVNTTPAYLFRKVSDPDGVPTILYDEIDTVFGIKTAKDNEDIRGMLNAGHRKGAVAGRCVIKGKQVVTEELPAYCAVAMAGLDDLPDTLRSRSVVVRMRRRAPDETVRPWRNRVNAPQAKALGEQLAAWVITAWDRIDGVWPDIPDGVTDRPADVWEALLVMADAAGGDWPERARAACVELVAAAADMTPTIGVRLLSDLLDVFAAEGVARMTTEAVLERLVAIDDAPWSDMRGKPLDARGLSRRLAKYDIKPKVIRVGNSTPRGYDAGELLDSWARYVPGSAPLCAQVREALSATYATGSSPDVADVAHVAGTQAALPTHVADRSYEAEHDTQRVTAGGTESDEGESVGPTRAEPATYATGATVRAKGACPVCGELLDAWLVEHGYTTHPGCESDG